MAEVVDSTYLLELSKEAYDEVETLMLQAGFDYRFNRGPGSAIDMSGFHITRNDPSTKLVEIPKRKERKYPFSVEQLTKPTHDVQELYCFMCDQMVTAACDKVGCWHQRMLNAEYR